MLAVLLNVVGGLILVLVIFWAVQVYRMAKAESAKGETNEPPPRAQARDRKD